MGERISYNNTCRSLLFSNRAIVVVSSLAREVQLNGVSTGSDRKIITILDEIIGTTTKVDVPTTVSAELERSGFERRRYRPALIGFIKCHGFVAVPTFCCSITNDAPSGRNSFKLS